MSKRLAGRPQDFHSLFLRLEELILASSGADVFDEACKLVARKLLDETGNPAVLQIVADPDRTALDPDLYARCRALLAPFALSQAGEALDALFETLMTRTSKGQKGQFFTPRYVVDFCVALAAPGSGDRVLDPACGSGAFLNSALNAGVRAARGYDIDGRAVRVARLLLAAKGRDPAWVEQADALRTLPESCADIILTNPPFAGDILDAGLLAGFELASGRERVERDVLFLERCLRAVRPGGKLIIVLPHSKFAGNASRYIREWLLQNAQVQAVIGLGRNTFLPHTHQKANVLFALRRVSARNGKPEPIFFAQSRRDGKNTRGKSAGTHDLGEILQRYQSDVARSAGSRGETAHDKNLTLAPERHEARSVAQTEAGCIGTLATCMSTYVRPGDSGPFVVLDTTHAIDGFVSARALHAVQSLHSSKKRLEPGDVIISRLRPYLRQIAYVDADLFERFGDAKLCCSTEFYVLRSASVHSLAFLVPFLLSASAQERLARSQEGGHHPRVPAEGLQGLAVPRRILRERDDISRDFLQAITAFRRAEIVREAAIERASAPIEG